MATPATYEEARRSLAELLQGLHQTGVTRRHQPHCNYKAEEVVPRSYLIGMGVYREVEALMDWLEDHNKRKTVPRQVVEDFLRRVVDIIPHELHRICLMDERMMSLNMRK